MAYSFPKSTSPTTGIRSGGWEPHQFLADKKTVHVQIKRVRPASADLKDCHLEGVLSQEEAKTGTLGLESLVDRTLLADCPKPKELAQTTDVRVQNPFRPQEDGTVYLKINMADCAADLPKLAPKVGDVVEMEVYPGPIYHFVTDVKDQRRPATHASGKALYRGVPVRCATCKVIVP